MANVHFVLYIAFATAMVAAPAISAEASLGRFQDSDQCQEFSEYRVDPERKIDKLAYAGAQCGEDIIERVLSYGKGLYYSLPVEREGKLLGGWKYAHIASDGPGRMPTAEGGQKWEAYKNGDGAIKEAVKTACG